MKALILDTDIGGDCDDAAACVLLKSAAEAGAIRLLGVTSATSRPGAPDCVAAILGYYGMRVPLGRYEGGPFMEDSDTYAKVLAAESALRPETEEAVALLRRLLAEDEEKVTLLAIGPQNNLAALLASPPDAHSPLCGAELVGQKTAELVVMGGCFLNEREKVYYEESVEIDTEYNIRQDIAAARAVAERWPAPVVYVPFELGHRIFTGERLPAGSPARRCFEVLGLDRRESWDPIAAYYAAFGADDLFSLSETGTVTVDEAGLTRFVPGRGNRRALLARASEEEIARRLNDWIR